MPSRTERANAIRALAMDAVQQANSGHPGAPMGLADVGEVLWREVLRHNPSNPAWFGRDLSGESHHACVGFAVLAGFAGLHLHRVRHLAAVWRGLRRVQYPRLLR